MCDSYCVCISTILSVCMCVCVGSFSHLKFLPGRSLFGPLFAIFNCQGFFKMCNMHMGLQRCNPLSETSRQVIHYWGSGELFFFRPGSFHFMRHSTFNSIHTLFHYSFENGIHCPNHEMNLGWGIRDGCHLGATPHCVYVAHYVATAHIIAAK